MKGALDSISPGASKGLNLVLPIDQFSNFLPGSHFRRKKYFDTLYKKYFELYSCSKISTVQKYTVFKFYYNGFLLWS